MITNNNIEQNVFWTLINKSAIHSCLNKGVR